MKEIEVVGLGKNTEDYLTKLVKVAGLSPKFISWEDARVSSQAPLILIIDEDHIDSLHEICEERDLKVIVALNSRKEFKIVSKLNEHFGKIFGFLDLSQEIDYNTPLVLNYINMNFSSHAIKLEKLSSDLNKIYEFTKSELTRVKDIHDRLVKVRVDQLKGVSVTSKFMAGEKSGGEFFDLLQSENNFLYIQAGSNNYIISSLILSEFEVLKLSTPTTSLFSQSEHFEKMIVQHAKENNAEINYCILNINLHDLSVQFRARGNGGLYFQGEFLDFSKSQNFKIKPSEQLIILSNGSLKNLAALNHTLSLKEFFEEHKSKTTRDLINEFFFEVSRNKAGSFLIYDALMSVVEVDQKTLYKI